MRHWVQITSGRGPAECAWTVPRVLRCMLDEAANLGVKVEMLESVAGPFSGTLSSVLIALEGGSSRELLARWLGTVQWVGQSPFRRGYKRKNWFVGVESFAMPECPTWSEKELKFETMRASGPGGQHVNKTESAVRVTHLPTGLSAMAREERSQSANRKLALARLAEQLDARGKANVRTVQRQRWSQHNTLERGDPVRVYEGNAFKLRQ
jgi:peptide chain release factor